MFVLPAVVLQMYSKSSVMKHFLLAFIASLTYQLLAWGIVMNTEWSTSILLVTGGFCAAMALGISLVITGKRALGSGLMIGQLIAVGVFLVW